MFAHDEGRKAAATGQDRASNPYAADTSEHHDWNEGFDAEVASGAAPGGDA